VQSFRLDPAAQRLQTARKQAAETPSAESPGTGRRYHRLAMADERELSLQEQLEGIGAQLDWVRGYL
jgi:hypothetical protein